MVLKRIEGCKGTRNISAWQGIYYWFFASLFVLSTEIYVQLAYGKHTSYIPLWKPRSYYNNCYWFSPPHSSLHLWLYDGKTIIEEEKEEKERNDSHVIIWILEWFFNWTKWWRMFCTVCSNANGIRVPNKI